MNFDEIRKSIVGWDQSIDTIQGSQPMIYADWVAGGRLYQPIEERMLEHVGPWLANTHSYSNRTGSYMTAAYIEARNIIKQHVNASATDMLVMTGSGMTGALRRFLQILKLDRSSERPVVLMSHMEHHSHQVGWIETGAEVVVVPPNENLTVDLSIWQSYMEQYRNRQIIAAFTSGSNVTGILLPVHELAALAHSYGGKCFVDYAATAPYVHIDMHPDEEEESLDAIYFSPHKFLGGPGAAGVLLFDEALYDGISSIPGGGNVTWTKPWGGYGITVHKETKEDGGTPSFLQTIRAALSIRLKEKMGVDNIENREKDLLSQAIKGLSAIERVQILGDLESDRIGVISFNIIGIHYNAVVRMLNDYFGIQVRGGWACASTYVHYLFDIDETQSDVLTCSIDEKDLTNKPGFVRLSLHPTMTDEELQRVISAVVFVAERKAELIKDYRYNKATNDFERIGRASVEQQEIDGLFAL